MGYVGIDFIEAQKKFFVTCGPSWYQNSRITSRSRRKL